MDKLTITQAALRETVARAIAPHLEGGREFDQMPPDRIALRTWARQGMALINDATQDDAREAADAAMLALSGHSELAGLLDALAGDCDEGENNSWENHEWATAAKLMRDAAQALLRQPLSDATMLEENERLRKALGEICTDSNPDWTEKRKYPCDVLDDIHTMAVDAYYHRRALTQGKPETPEIENG